jgi:hypothetical protein
LQEEDMVAKAASFPVKFPVKSSSTIFVTQTN